MSQQKSVTQQKAKLSSLIKAGFGNLTFYFVFFFKNEPESILPQNWGLSSVQNYSFAKFFFTQDRRSLLLAKGSTKIERESFGRILIDKAAMILPPGALCFTIYTFHIKIKLKKILQKFRNVDNIEKACFLCVGANG